MEGIDKGKEPKKLSELYEDVFKRFRGIEDSDLPSVSEKYQDEVKECIGLLIKCTNMVNTLMLFSSNEHYDEISTQNIKYLLLPVFLGELYQKLTTQDRKETISTALIYFKDFLKRCNDYKVTGKDLSCYYCQEEGVKPKQQTREEKIQKYSQTKKLKEKIDIIQKRLKENKETVDEDVLREYYTDLLKYYINQAIDNIKLIQDELEILAHMKNMKINPKPVSEEKKKKLPPMKPIVITRETIKNQVFGAGYKNLPTMTEEEYFQMELRQGKIVQEFNKNSVTEKHEDDESSDEEETEEKLQKARQWDDWKDTHRRGEGNKERNG